MIIALIVALILCAIVYVLPLPPPFKTVAYLVVLLIALLWVLGGPGIVRLR